MTDYKNTLNLPRTSFPMRADLANREPLIMNRWIKEKIYDEVRQAKKGKPVFVLHDGPPYANGSIHLGHAVNKVLKDIIIRFKGLSDIDAPFIPGWDCHGLPIELKVEQKLGKPSSPESRKKFRAACRKYAEEQVNVQKEGFLRLGILGDWEAPYLTMSFEMQANALRTLADVIKKGNVLRGLKPVFWCTECASALAEAEVEYEEKESLSLELGFKASDAAAVYKRFGLPASDIAVAAIIWTTTAWTLPANQALAFHPEVTYALISPNDASSERWIIAAARAEEIVKKWGYSDYRVISYIKGSLLEGLRFRHPFIDRESQAIVSDHVQLDEGTGIVHIAPAHGVEDYEVGLRYGLPIESPVTATGFFSNTIPELADSSIFHLATIQRILDLLLAKSALKHSEMLVHSYPHCWRHKTALIYLATPQWFINLEKNALRARVGEAIKTVAWYPTWGGARLADMVQSRPDWCISRQRTWGLPFPVFIHKTSGALHHETVRWIEQLAEAVEKEGVEAWWDLKPETLLGEATNEYEKSSDILDVWFDSGATYDTVVKHRGLNATGQSELYLEGSDQHRGWFMASLLLSVATQDKAPYKAVLTHGFTVDEAGKKMSKSLGNVISPQEIIAQSGSDVLRLWIASLDYTAQMTLSATVMQQVSERYRRIRNTVRFLLGNLHDFDPNINRVCQAEMVLLDQWAVSIAQTRQQAIIAAYDAYEFHVVAKEISHFCNLDMGSCYLDIIKDRLYTVKHDSLARRSAQTAIFHIVEALVRWLAPILPFTADEIWHCLPKGRAASVFTQTWYQGLFSFDAQKTISMDSWKRAFRIRESINQVMEHARQAKVIGGTLDAELSIFASAEVQRFLSLFGNELHCFFMTSAVLLRDLAAAGEAAISCEGETGLKLLIRHASGKKCPRCWHYTEVTPIATEVDGVCARCCGNIGGMGESRSFV